MFAYFDLLLVAPRTTEYLIQPLLRVQANGWEKKRVDPIATVEPWQIAPWSCALSVN